ncbi:hypothetical protein D9M73_267900 [compost metagenome]
MSAWPTVSNAITTTAAPYCMTFLAWARNCSSPSFMLIELTIGLPLTHFSPASITDHFELSTMNGMRAMSGSAAISLRKVTIAYSASSRPSSMLMSSTCAPDSTCCRATSTAAG